LEDSDIPHRTKLRSSIMQSFRNYFQTLKANLSESVGKVSFTANIWSSGNRTSYLGITAHWIAHDQAGLHLRTALIAFTKSREATMARPLGKSSSIS
ncbi:hypothetical protein BD779DRAFT_1454440, partial [Infundibulicybe gibba]